MSAPPTAVVVGASRGLGLAIATDLAGRGWTVLATVRGAPPPPALASLPGVAPVPGVDVATDAGEAALAEAVRGRDVGLIVYNAAVMVKEADLAAFDGGNAAAALAANAVGFVRCVRAVESALSPGARVLLVSSQMGSVARAAAGPAEGAMLSYRMSKAAANAAAAALAARLRPRGVAVGVVHPGAVATDMYSYYHGGGAAAFSRLAAPGAPSTPAEAAKEVVDVALALQATDAFVFRTVEGGGGVLPW
jgi:NAD(P)-dependent dehydrogenase (short-subunit alcohol dehydrogenase family)